MYRYNPRRRPVQDNETIVKNAQQIARILVIGILALCLFIVKILKLLAIQAGIFLIFIWPYIQTALATVTRMCVRYSRVAIRYLSPRIQKTLRHMGRFALTIFLKLLLYIKYGLVKIWIAIRRLGARLVNRVQSHLASIPQKKSIQVATEPYLPQTDVSSLASLSTTEARRFVRWIGLLFVPRFLMREHGKPSILDNFRLLFRHSYFRPLRRALIAWLIFALGVSSSGLYILIKSPEARAVGDFSIQTGYYYGTGTTRSVTGLGFTPELVLIKADTVAGALVWKSSAMPSAVTTYLGVATADNTETEITLDADGFTVSAALEVNTINVTYTFIAFAGSDCTSGGVFCVGVYTGNAGSTQEIETGFQPDLVWVKRTTALAGTFRTSSMNNNHAALFSATANDTSGVYFQTLNSDGFTVGATNNTNGGAYYYVAFKSLATKLFVGQFTGNGTDNRNITGVGFEPDFVMVKQTSATVALFNTTEMYGDYSSLTTATASAVNHIQSLDADGFQVGNSTSINVNGIVNYYFAFGGSPDPTPAGTFFMQRGSYTGNGTTQTLETSFAPNLVFIKGNTTQQAVWSSSLEGDATEYFAVAGAAFTSGITGMTDTAFTIGSHATVNSSGIVYEYVAFGNATSPRKGDGAADFYIGTFTGNGIDQRAIDHLGFAPSMVVVKRSIGTANQSVWKADSPVMANDTTAYFSGTADNTAGALVRTLTSDGFTLGTNAAVNAVGATYVWFAFAEGANFDIGSYSGDSTADREITGVGFAPDFVWTKRDTNAVAVHKSSSPTIETDQSQHFTNLANDTNDIKSFTSDGFILGNSAEVNTTGGTYRYAAWNSTTSSYPPATPTNSAPTAGATGQDLNVTLTGSNYSDPDDNAQTGSQWQVDDDSDFSSPVWTRSSGSSGVTTSVTSGNGTFANELSGKTQLDHTTTYYWRVRYTDGVYSGWSTGTSFTTNAVETPTHSSPSDGGTVVTFTPTLTASAFSDPQSGHTAASAQWQISTTNSFSSPLYDSGTVSYSNSHAVPAATLSDKSAYYWRVRYADSDGFWSSYSTPTRFLVFKADVTVTPLFGNTVVDQGDTVKIDAQVKLADGTVVNDATVTLNIYNPSGTKIVTNGSMSYVTDSNGVYRYSYTVPATSGSYLYEVTATSNSINGYGAANFEVRTIQSDVAGLSSDLSAILEDTGTTLPGQIENASSSLAIEINQNEAKIDTLNANLDVLLGALVVVQSTVNDATATVTSFVTSLTNAVDDFYNNAVLMFTSGALSGQTRRISDYNGTTKTITLDPALTSAPANGAAFTIVGQNTYSQQQIAEHETAQAAFRADTTDTLTDIQSTVDTIATNVTAIQTLLNTVDTKIDAVDSIVDTIRSSQTKNFSVVLSDFDEVNTGGTYRAQVSVFDFEHQPATPSSTPQLAIYDSTRNLIIATTTMAVEGTGLYSYSYTVDSSDASGVWETKVIVNFAGVDSYLNDYWEVEGSPAQVAINSITDTSIPTISASATIQNEGTGAYEYQYEYCVVAEETNQCGGGDDIARATGAKLLTPGETWNTTLSLTVPTAGSYYFKLIVYYGTEKSGASRLFTATEAAEPAEEDDEPAQTGSTRIPGGGLVVGPISYGQPESGDLHREVRAIQASVSNALGEIRNIAQLIAGAAALSGRLDTNAPGFKGLLEISEQSAQDLQDVKNKVTDLRAISTVTRRIVEQKMPEPIVESWMTFGSIELNFLITNPSTVTQVMPFKAFLPAEVRPEHIVDLGGLKIDFDANANTYYVSAQFSLAPKETITRKVKIMDIWMYEDSEFQSIQKQVSDLTASLSKTQYSGQATLLKSDIEATLDIIKLNQEKGYASPQDHIFAHRENIVRMAKATEGLAKLRELVADSSSSEHLVGRVGGIQTFATWGIVVAIVSGMGMLALILFSMWRHQMALANAQIALHSHLTGARSEHPMQGLKSAKLQSKRKKSLAKRDQKKR